MPIYDIIYKTETEEVLIDEIRAKHDVTIAEIVEVMQIDVCDIATTYGDGCLKLKRVKE